MTLNIKDDRTDRLVRALASETGESLTEAVANAAAERLERIRGSRSAPDLAGEIVSIGKRVAAMPVLDDRTPDQILGFDSDGLPT